MFGYVKPCSAHLYVWEQERFKATYCGVCRALSKRYGPLARNLLQYDFVFLALLLDEPEICPKRKRCPVHPLRGCQVAEMSGALESAADATVLMAYFKLKDGVRDSGFWRSIPYRLALLWLRPKYRRAAARLPGTDDAAKRELAVLAGLEDENAPSMDAPADTFAKILAEMSEAAPDDRRRAVASLLYHVGRWIYLVDAADDLEEDCGKGRYNPVAARFGIRDGRLGPEPAQALSVSLSFSRASASLALGLIETGRNRGILENILGKGLASVERRVFGKSPEKETNE